MMLFYRMNRRLKGVQRIIGEQLARIASMNPILRPVAEAPGTYDVLIKCGRSAPRTLVQLNRLAMEERWTLVGMSDDSSPTDPLTDIADIPPQPFPQADWLGSTPGKAAP